MFFKFGKFGDLYRSLGVLVCLCNLEIFKFFRRVCKDGFLVIFLLFVGFSYCFDVLKLVCCLVVFLMVDRNVGKLEEKLIELYVVFIFRMVFLCV